jgi:hypothetical protein
VLAVAEESVAVQVDEVAGEVGDRHAHLPGVSERLQVRGQGASAARRVSSTSATAMPASPNGVAPLASSLRNRACRARYTLPDRREGLAEL